MNVRCSVTYILLLARHTGQRTVVAVCVMRGIDPNENFTLLTYVYMGCNP